MMKRVWAAQLEVLVVVGQICTQNDLQYFADWGTLLGAVRHKGFIPWDDDMDICMLRRDYDKFLAAAEKELPDEYRILDPNTNTEWDEVCARIINSDTVSYSEERLGKFHGCPYSVGIDIYPLDELPEDPQLERCHTELFSTVFSCARLYAKEPSEVMAILPDLEKLCKIKFDRSKSIPHQLFKLADAIGKEYRDSGSPFITYMAYHASKRLFLRKEWYANPVYLPYEHLEIPVPSNYDAVLTAQYGDYMTPVRYAADHDYPFYKKQQKIYEQQLS
ncbi:MAG: LicD family protein [Lachnospiraceae bacterium]|nr:LicD family protein [Lachnospiraceae bacterium]MCM1302715.1 LicD family protein [Butyrivibrio sp.]MCM1342435.1 LicD family protein [Muribaculaceae bacterium]